MLVARQSLAPQWPRVSRLRHGHADEARELWFRRAVGSLCRLVYQRASPQLVKRQRRVHPPRVVEVAIYQSVQKMADIEPALAAGGVQVTYDIDRAAIGQQI